MKKKQLLLIATLLLNLPIFSQSLYGVINYDKKKVTPFYDAASKANVKLYLKNGWTEGSMILKDSTFISPATFRYDALNDRMEIRMIVKPQNVDKIVFGGQFFIFSKFFFNGDEREGYFELLNTGKAKLLKRYFVNLFPGKQGALGHKSFNAIGTKYFLKVGNSSAISIKSSKKEIIHQFKDNDYEIKNFITTNKINVKNKKDLIKLITYYNKL